MAKSFWEKMQAIDRRIIFLFVAVGVVVPLLVPLRLGVSITSRVRSIYDTIDKLEKKEGKERPVILIAADFDPSAAPELYPMLESVVNHCMQRNHRVIVATLWPGAAGLINNALDEQAKRHNRVKGEDYIFLGYKAGGTPVILGMGQDMKKTFPEVDNRPYSDIPVLRGIDKLSDIDYAVSISAGVPGIDQWVIFGSEKYKFKIGGGCTGVMATQYFPYLQAKQLNGLMGGLKGAAEYEMLLMNEGREKETGSAVQRMDPQAVTHIAIIAFIILGNIAYFATKKTRKS
jgi:hypothetical protein